jgi:predicted anti-sigma-YlaC factor YlaD
MMKHYDLDTLDDYLHAELDSARDAAVHAHLEMCDPCRAAYDEMAAVRDWVRAAAAADEREFPALVKARVWEAIRNEPVAQRRWWAPLAGPWLALPVAAAIALVAYLGIPIPHPPAAGVAASDLLLEHAAQMADNPLADHGLVVPASIVGSQQPTATLIEAADATAIADPGP